MMFGEVVFEIDKKDLLKKTKKMNLKAQRKRRQEDKEAVGAIADLEDAIMRARKAVRKFRNDKASPEFREAKARVATLKRQLEQVKLESTEEYKMEVLTRTMQAKKREHKLQTTAKDAAFRSRAATELKKRNLLKHPQSSHPADWNFSVNPYHLIDRPFAPLGPSRPSLLRIPQTRFGPPPKGKPSWVAVPEGGDFGETPVPRVLHTGGVEPDPEDKEIMVASRSGSLAGRRKADDVRRRRHARELTERRDKIYNSRNSRGGSRRPWSAGCAVSRIFSDPDYNRPPTALERAMASKQAQADRVFFQPHKTGETPWRPTSALNRSLTLKTDVIPTYHTDDARSATIGIASATFGRRASSAASAY